MVNKIENKLIILTLCVLSLFATSACSKSFVLRQAVCGTVYENDKPIEGVMLQYDSTDIFSPINIRSDSTGRFVLPEVRMEDYKAYRKALSKINTQIILTKRGYQTLLIDISNYRTLNDTVFINRIEMKKQ